MSEPQSLQHKVRQRQAARATLSGLVAAAFAFFLAGAAQANTGQGFKALGGDGVAAFTAAGYAVDPFRAASIHSGTGPQEG